MERIRTEILHKQNQVCIIECVEEYSNYYVYTLEGCKNSIFLNKEFAYSSYDLDAAVSRFEELVFAKLKNNYMMLKEGTAINILGYNPEYMYSLHEL